MSLASRIAAELPSLMAPIHYLTPMSEKPYRYACEPPPGAPETNAGWRAHAMRIADMRPIADRLSLDDEGFALVDHKSAVADFYDEDELKRVYYPEAERLVARATGATRVVVFDHTIRRSDHGPDDRTQGPKRDPVYRAHNDYTERSAPQRVRDLLGAESDRLLERRFAIVNVWRPIRGPLEDSPLAVCDASSTGPGDLVATDLIYRDRVGETYGLRHNSAHRWFYAPAMRRDEALLLKCFDSVRSGVARFAPHTAFEDPATLADALPRESIEVRTLAFF
jgi:hypothetical protein